MQEITEKNQEVNKLKILISNDDGIAARGLRTLAVRLAQDPNNQVYVCAPDRERSATGHGLTLHKPLRVEEADLGDKIKGAWYTTGTPSDCVKFAVGFLLEKDRPDFVISGINAGANLGSEVLYSGTVSAAMEGAFFDIPSVAVSLTGKGHRVYDVAADFIAKLMPILHSEKMLVGKTMLNVNVPNVPAAQIQGVRATRLGVRAYNDYFEKRVDPRGKVYYWLAGEAIEDGEEEGTDAWSIAHNLISLTPISFNMTDFPRLEQLHKWGKFAHAFEVPMAANAQAMHQQAANKEAK
jgi:5'-nucleotidase